MDNPISWAILTILVIYGIWKFLQKVDAEIYQIKKEEEIFWKNENTK